jgi:PAS domain S-box-containing protein
MMDAQDLERRLVNQPRELLVAELVRAYQKLESVGDELQAANADRRALRRALEEKQVVAQDIANRDQAILASMREGLVVFDLQGNIVEMNEAALRLHGYDSVAEVRRHLYEFATGFELWDMEGRLLASDDWPLGRVLRGEKLAGYEVRVHNARTGKISVWSYNGGLILDQDGSPFLGILTIRDATSRKAAEAERERLLAENRGQREFLEGLLHDVPLAIAVVGGPEHRFELANVEHYSIPGQPATAVVGRTLAEAFPELAPAAARAIDKVYRTGRPVRVREHAAVLEPGGPEGHWNADYVPLRDTDDNVERVLILIREVTEEVLARRRIEELASQAQQQADELDAMFEAMVEAVIVYDEFDRPAKANRAARVAYGPALEGRERPEIIRLLNLRHLDGRPIALEESPVDRALRGETVQGARFLFAHAQGGDRVMSASAAPLPGQEGRRGAVAVWHDVTAQMQAQKQIEALAAQARQQAQELDAVFEAIIEAVMVYDSDGTLIAVNRAARELYGLEQTGMKVADVVRCMNARHPDGLPFSLEETAAARALTGLAVSGTPMLVRGADGQERSVVASGAPLRHNGQPAGAVVVWHDVSEQAQTLVALAAERARLEAVVENAPEGIVLADDQGRIVLTNPAADRLHLLQALAGDELDCEGEIRICHPDGKPWAPRKLPLTCSALDGETLTEVEQLLVLPDGRRRSLMANTAPIRDVEGGVTGAVGVFQDITEQVAVRETLRRRNEELQALTYELEAYDYTVAHDLKTPLSMIVGSADLLSSIMAHTEAEGPQRMLRNILEGTGRMNDIVESLLLLASTRSNEVGIETLDMASIVAGACRALEPEIVRTGAQLRVAESWPAVLGYAPWIESVWTNYLSNALKYGGNPPCLELGFDLKPAPAEPPVPGGIARFWVRDRGRGLTDEEKARLFVPFSRLDRPEKLGHGLGLALVRRIVIKLGGQVGVDSQAGEGSTFWFTLPRSKP